MTREELELFLEAGHLNPKRVTLALDSIDAEGPDVDVACGAVEPAVDEWEAGTRIPSVDQLLALARYTGMRPEWFFVPGPDDPSWLVFCQRSGRGRGCTMVKDGQVVAVSRRRRARPARTAARTSPPAPVDSTPVDAPVPPPQGWRPERRPR